MASPDQVAHAARRKEDENYDFRSYLKMNADPDELDQQFRKLHQELFSEYACSKCRNCCKEYCGTIPEEDISRDASFLGMADKEFIDKYLKNNAAGGEYETKHRPCDFWDERTGDCILGENKPENCLKYPYTDQPGRMWSLLSIVESASTCPVVYEILERLKEEYHFKKRTGRKIYPNAPCPCGSGKKYKYCCGRCE